MPRPPRIVFISGNAPPSIDGVGDYTDRLLFELRRERPEWRWSWISRRPRWYSTPLTRRQGIPLYRPSRTWNSAGLAIKLVRAIRPDLLHIQEELYSFHETEAASRIARSIDVPIVTTVHEFHLEHPRIDQTIGLIEASDCLISNDERTAARCRESTGRTVDRTLWTGTPIDPPDPSDRPPTVPGLVVTFGFISALKSLEMLHDALKIARISRHDLRWRIIGPFEPETDPWHAALRDRFAEEGSWIEIVGAVHDKDRLRRLVGEAVAMLLPYADGASTRRGTLQVAWALGLPAVTTAPDRPCEVIRDQKNVLLAETGEAWTRAVLRILSEPELVVRLRKEALETAEQFSWKRLAEEHFAIYDKLLEK